jgi:hypothetical protein
MLATLVAASNTVISFIIAFPTRFGGGDGIGRSGSGDNITRGGGDDDITRGGNG